MQGGWEGDSTDLLARLLLLYPARRDTLPQPWRAHVLVVVDAELDGATGRAREAIRRRVVDRIEEVFSHDEAMFRLGETRFAVVARRHPGLVRTLGAFEDLVHARGPVEVAAWCEELPADPEELAAVVRRARRRIPVYGAAAFEALFGAPARAGRSPDARRPARPWAVGAISAAAAAAVGILVTASMLATSGDDGDTVLAGQAASDRDALGDSGYVVVEESSEDGVTRLVVAPDDPGTTTVPSGPATGAGGEPVDRGGVAAASPTPVTVVAIGTTAEEALAALPDDLQGDIVFTGVPAPAEIPADEPVAIVLEGVTPPELCVLMAAVPDAVIVADQPDCGGEPTPSPFTVPSAA